MTALRVQGRRLKRKAVPRGSPRLGGCGTGSCAHRFGGGAPSSSPLLPQQGTAPMHFTVNGQAHDLAPDVRTSLLDLLREHLYLTGTKKGCDQGACGACTVLVDGERINSCLALAVQYQGREITTKEGLGRPGALHPLQQAFIDCDGF